MNSGIYIVELKNRNPIYSCAHEINPNKKGTLLDYKNIKFGRAKDLHLRRNNYIRTFGYENISFTTIVETDQYIKLEKLVKNEVRDARVIGVHGRRLEWLHKDRIDFLSLKKIILKMYDQLNKI